MQGLTAGAVLRRLVVSVWGGLCGLPPARPYRRQCYFDVPGLEQEGHCPALNSHTQSAGGPSDGAAAQAACRLLLMSRSVHSGVVLTGRVLMQT